METWKIFKSYKHRVVSKGGKEYFYDIIWEVSNKGNFRCNGKPKIPRMSKQDKYLRIRGNELAHRVVAEAFIPNPDNKPCVDHINRDRTDNRVENLRWVTMKENMNNPLTRNHINNLLDTVWNRKKIYRKTPLVLLLEKMIPIID